jgi:hypothetical protein
MEKVEVKKTLAGMDPCTSPVQAGQAHFGIQPAAHGMIMYGNRL